MVKESELKITGKTLTERTLEAFHQFLDGKMTLSDDIWAEIGANIKSIGENSAGQFVCDTAEKILTIFFCYLPNLNISSTERDILLSEIEIIVDESFDPSSAPYYYVYTVNNHGHKAIARYIDNHEVFSNLEDARKWRDAAVDYYDTIFRVKIIASGCIHWNFVLSVEKLNPTVEQIVSNLQDSIAEHEGYANDPDYDELEQHDARVAVEAFQSVLNFINRITGY